MKSLVEYINESKEDLQRFKIDNLKDELETNRVSSSRISEIIKFFKTVLGELMDHIKNNEIGPLSYTIHTK